MNDKYVEKLSSILKVNVLDAMLVVPSEELLFLAGFSPMLCERFQGLFIKDDGDWFYFCNLLTKDDALEYFPEERIYTWFDNDGFIDDLKKVMDEKHLTGKKIGLNSTARAFNILDIIKNIDVEFVNGKGFLEEMRIIKSSRDIENLKEASRRTDIVMESIISEIKPGMTELDIVERLELLFTDNGMDMEFAIIATGPNSALPHHESGKRIIQNKDIVLMDIGGKYNDVYSDMTRTVFVGGVTKKEIEIYNLVLEAQMKGIECAGAGVEAKKVDGVARSVIENKGYGQYFTTRLGHGIGYSVHEGPYIVGYNDLELKDGMAFSIEPGIYMKDEFGVRIEDLVIIEDGEGNSINSASKELIVV
jgi:Xaa-Pro dipeptidase